MKITNYIVASAMFISTSAIYCAKADDSSTTMPANQPTPSVTTTTTRESDDDSYPLYRKQEVDVDIYGSGAVGQSTLEHLSDHSFRHHSLWGGGGGVTAFFCRYVGVGGEFDADARSHQFVDSASGNVYLRLPILETGLAPYVFGGGGYQFEDFRQAFGQGGGGLEFRFCHHIGIFVDGRWVFANRSDDYALARAGLRLSF